MARKGRHHNKKIAYYKRLIVNFPNPVIVTLRFAIEQRILGAMTSREHSVIVDPKGFSGSLQELARMLVPLVGQPSSTLIKRLEGGEITIECDLSFNRATQIVNRLRQVGVPAQVKNQVDLLDIELSDSFQIEDVQFLEYESENDQNHNPWQSLFPDLDQEGESNLLDQGKNASEKIIPSLGELENQRLASPLPSPSLKESHQILLPTPSRGKRAPRHAEVMMKELTAQKKKAPFQPAGFDDAYEHSPELSLLFSLAAPGAGHRYNGEDGAAGTLAISGFFVWPWIRSVKDSFEKGKQIQTYYAPRPKAGALKRAIIHMVSFWCIMGVIISASYLVYRQYLQHSEMEHSDIKIAHKQIQSAIISTKLKLAEARFAGVEGVREELNSVPKQDISMSEDEHLRRLYAIGVQKCKKGEYTQCQGIMSRVSKLHAGYEDVLKLQTWASAQRTAVKKTPMPDIKDVPSLDEIEEEQGLLPRK